MNLRDAIDFFLMSCSDEGGLPTPAEIDSRVDEFLSGPLAVLRPSRDAFAAEILRRLQVRVGSASTLDSFEGHLAWLPAHDRSGWRLWPRLLRYLQREEALPPAVLHELDDSTDCVLERLEAADRAGMWDRRGLVVGNVQSGKTTHYTTLAAKALDAGYQIVVVLAGIHNSLRSQTHERIDRHLIGRDSASLLQAMQVGSSTTPPSTHLIGVGAADHAIGAPSLPFSILTCTSSAENGDFVIQVANQVGFQVSTGSRLVMVVKKNASILKTLIKWLRTQNAGAGRAKAPTLVIDDEADHASINTSADPDADPTAINRLIRRLLRSFERVSFVGYTATPFGNIFIAPEADHEDFGADLFPKAFIVNLKAPSDYVGPAMVFGHPGDESLGIPDQPPLPMHAVIADHEAWLPDKHKKDQLPGPVPASLREAIGLFALVCAARAASGSENVHNSMLVHATRFVAVQRRVRNQIDQEVDALRNTLDFGGSANAGNVRAELERLWNTRVAEQYSNFKTRIPALCAELPEFPAVLTRVPTVLSRLKVMEVNGDATDALAYSRAVGGLYAIAIGGDELSRGLTLEGLSVSYFLRTSRMFDTLMQMGRWFGYRPGYVHLCRVYTTQGLYNSFSEIALAMDDLRADLDRMAAAGRTPMEFGLRVRIPSEGLLITAANKIRSGEPVQVRFAGARASSRDSAHW